MAPGMGRPARAAAACATQTADGPNCGTNYCTGRAMAHLSTDRSPWLHGTLEMPSGERIAMWNLNSLSPSSVSSWLEYCSINAYCATHPDASKKGLFCYIFYCIFRRVCGGDLSFPGDHISMLGYSGCLANKGCSHRSLPWS
jgi:hypothetical protein